MQISFNNYGDYLAYLSKRVLHKKLSLVIDSLDNTDYSFEFDVREGKVVVDINLTQTISRTVNVTVYPTN